MCPGQCCSWASNSNTSYLINENFFELICLLLLVSLNVFLNAFATCISSFAYYSFILFIQYIFFLCVLLLYEMLIEHSCPQPLLLLLIFYGQCQVFISLISPNCNFLCLLAYHILVMLMISDVSPNSSTNLAHFLFIHLFQFLAE